VRYFTTISRVDVDDKSMEKYYIKRKLRTAIRIKMTNIRAENVREPMTARHVDTDRIKSK
jgi:hypothetical protein